MADNRVDMVTVDGVRYRPEDAPKVDKKDAEEPAKKAAKAPANKARSASDK
jgi:hypothetical protein